jgi:hypothetical protein
MVDRESFQMAAKKQMMEGSLAPCRLHVASAFGLGAQSLSRDLQQGNVGMLKVATTQETDSPGHLFEQPHKPAYTSLQSFGSAVPTSKL